ncbi:hypothetical protein [Pseudomonas sp. KCJK8751]|uniref:hypothetical protein n=1 Tax=Pseudomonas sp. KCJK8751 TaxID=3344564 RepID=UPI003906B7DD
MKKENTSPGEWGGARGFEGFYLYLYWIVGVPVCYIVFVPWLSLAVIKNWAAPVFPGFFNAMASTGWLIASFALFSFIAYMTIADFIIGRRRKKAAAKSL